MNVLNNPYPLDFDFNKSFTISFVVGFFVFFFLFVFQPAEIMFSTGRLSVFDDIAYALITFVLMMLFYHYFLILLPKIFNEENWTVKNALIQHFTMILSIAIFNMLYSIIKIGDAYSFTNVWNSFFELFIITFTMAIFPAIVIVFYNQNNLLKQYLQETENINTQLGNKTLINDMLIHGEGKNESVHIEIDKLFFIKSQGNYCEIYVANIDKAKLIRSSLLAIQKQISEAGIYKCHRSYLVNLANVSNVTGNAQGLRLHFSGLKDSVPVSRALTNEVKELLLSKHS